MKHIAWIILATASLSGCGHKVKAPAPLAEDELITPVAKSPKGMSSYSGFNKALQQAMEQPNDMHHSALLEEGMQLVMANCMQYLTRLGNAGQITNFTRKETGLASTLATASLGLARASATAIAGTASAFGFTTATMDNFSDTYLFSPDIAAVQALLLTAMESRITQGRSLIKDALQAVPPTPSKEMNLPRLTYSEVNQF